MGRTTKQRRNQHGSARHWKQTDCWYHTPHGMKRREALIDQKGKRIRGVDNKQSARPALTRIRLRQGLASAIAETPFNNVEETWPVARVCSLHLEH